MVKKEHNRFVSLDSQDEINKKLIADVFLKYEWPMVITNSSLTEDEKNELLSSDQEYAEEKFISKQLKKINSKYDVVFIPTILYECFIINEKNNGFYFNDDVHHHRIELHEIINSTKDSQHEIYKNVHTLFESINNIYYPKLFLHFNDSFIKLLFKMYPEIAVSQNGDQVSKKIEVNLNKIINLCIDSNNDICRYAFLVTSIEYEARKSNKALFFRGTNEISQNIEGEELVLIASTIKQCKINEKSCEKIDPYSISFGNSLFAGYFYDKGACVASFLKYKKCGYSLFVNKKDYIQHHCLNLLYVAPLNTIASLFASGEWFHSRSKSAITCKNNKEYSVLGVCGFQLSDLASIILIERDPFEHAELFSQYVADNMRRINIDAPSSTGISVCSAIPDYRKNQSVAASYYAIMQMLYELKVS